MDRTLTLHRYKIPKDKFNKAPKDERVFFIRALHLLTDINVLQKAIVFSVGKMDTGAPGLKTSAQNAQAMCFIRQLAGTLNEAHELLNKGFFGKDLRATYLKDMDAATQSNLSELTRYFNQKDCLLRHIRDKFAFHYNLDKVDNELDDLSRFDQFDIYFSEAHGNCHYVAANDVLIFGMMALTGKKDLKEALDSIIGETTSIARRFQDFFGVFQMVFVLRHLDAHPDMEEIVLDDVPGLEEVRLPYFCRDTRGGQEAAASDTATVPGTARTG